MPSNGQHLRRLLQLREASNPHSTTPRSSPLIGLAQKAATADDALIAYRDLGNQVTPAGAHWPGDHIRGTGKALDQIAAFEHGNGQPMLATLVVRAGRGHRRLAGGRRGPGASVEIPEGDEDVFWREQVEAVIASSEHVGDD